MRVVVDPNLCCSSGLCSQSSPEVFDQDPDDGVVRLLLAEPPAHTHADVRFAAHGCPSGAIEILEHDTTGS
ncbi:ferredoxin [Rugosimonospora africana]|uniref:Ferredoxin n=1 Tax=Rugosimonospora africana TaxID=556532 RepID=A0A8J3VME8_9ACTN|nr:ferredoxin [Rugosimonospora africana]GIH11905.1 ferredoxin [Rugosimonospora africana]